MAVRFILGRSGTGKTRYCINSIVRELVSGTDNRPMVLLVPEQATYQAERAILSEKGVEGYSGLQVVSFERLLFQLCGRRTSMPSVSRLGQEMIVQRILRQKRNELKIFGSAAEQGGLAAKIAELITEFHQCAKTAEEMDDLVERMRRRGGNDIAEMKFSDIRLIWGEYQKFIESRFLNPDVEVNEAIKAVSKTDRLKGAQLWVDGFSGFTVQETAVLLELLKTASESFIALCLDPRQIDLKEPSLEKLDPLSLFGPTERTYVELADAVRKCKLAVAEPVILDRPLRFGKSAAIGHIERNLFAKQTNAKIAAGEQVKVIAAGGFRSEAEYVAREITHLVRDKGFRYRDIAVVASDIQTYQHYIRASFGDCGIPYFVDIRKPLAKHPAVEVISCGLNAAAGRQVGRNILGCLKTDLTAVSRYDADMLENYCLACGVKDAEWLNEQDWPEGGDDFDIKRLNAIRHKVIEPIIELKKSLAAADITAEDFTRAVFSFLDRLGIREKLSDWIKLAEAEKDFERAAEHRQFFNEFVNVFDEFLQVFGGQKLAVCDYIAILRTAFSRLSLAIIPPRADEVLVGSIERSRHPELRAIFLMGAVQNQFPEPVSFENLLGDADRMAAEAEGFVLGQTSEQKMMCRQYLAYIAFTRSSEYLYISYPLADSDAMPLKKSEFVSAAEELFAGFEEIRALDSKHNIDDVCNERELTDMLCRRLGRGGGEDKNDAELSGLLKLIQNDSELKGIGEFVEKAISYDNKAGLESDSGDTKRRMSAGRLGNFAACPYKHFAKYILNLRERKIFRFEPLDMGNFYHLVLDRFFKRLKKDREDIAACSTDKLKGLLKREIGDIFENDPQVRSFLTSSAANTYILDSASEVLEDFVLGLSRLAAAGEFRPLYSELKFGEGGEIGGCKILLSDGKEVSIRGKIDRIDAASADGKNLAVIFDYKRKGQSFNWNDFYYGLDLQLPIYMLAADGRRIEKYGDLEVVGAFYIPIEVKMKKRALGELVAAKQEFPYKARGLFNGDFAHLLDNGCQGGWSDLYNFYCSKDKGRYGHYNRSGALRPDDFAKVLKFAEFKIAEIARDIFSGRIEVSPYRKNNKSACQYCKYAAVCRFDRQINDYRDLKPVGGKDGFLAEAVGI